MALLPCRECGASISIEARTCPHCGAPDPTIQKNVVSDTTKENSGQADPATSTAPGPAKKWTIAGVIFALAVLAIIVRQSLPSPPPVPPPVPPIPQKEEDLAKLTEEQLINSLPADYRTVLIPLQQGNRRSAATALRTRAAAQDPKLLPAIDAIIKKEEHTGPYLYSQGNRYLADKQYDLAIQSFDEAISLGEAKSYDGRGVAWLEKHEFERAIADLTQAVKAGHGNYIVYLHRAEANEQKGDRESAIDDYRRALALAPDKKISDQINAALKRLNPALQPEAATSPRGRRAPAGTR